MTNKYVFMLEIPSTVSQDKRMMITRELKKIAYFQPKRNAFLIESESETKIKKIKEFVIANTNSDTRTKVFYYQIKE